MKAQQHSPTSIEAAHRIEPRTATLRFAVLEFIRSRKHEGATDNEVQLALGLHAHTQCPRRLELVEGGLVVDSGAVRKTASGRNAVVWVASEFGKRGPVKQMEFSL